MPGDGLRWFVSTVTPGGVVVEDFTFGEPGDIPLTWRLPFPSPRMPVVYRNGAFVVSTAWPPSKYWTVVHFGSPGDYPLSWGNDYYFGVYRNATFYLSTDQVNVWSREGEDQYLGPADVTASYGNPGDIPLMGDWNGRADSFPVDTIGVYRPSNAAFYLRTSNTSGVADMTFVYGDPGDMPVVGDWNGDGVDTIGVYRPSTATFYLRNSNTAGVADRTFVFGDPGDFPITNGNSNIAVVRVSS